LPGLLLWSCLGRVSDVDGNLARRLAVLVDKPKWKTPTANRAGEVEVLILADKVICSELVLIPNVDVNNPVLVGQRDRGNLIERRGI